MELAGVGTASSTTPSSNHSRFTTLLRSLFTSGSVEGGDSGPTLGCGREYYEGDVEGKGVRYRRIWRRLGGDGAPELAPLPEVLRPLVTPGPDPDTARKYR
jgi:hypothetical protein